MLRSKWTPSALRPPSPPAAAGRVRAARTGPRRQPTRPVQTAPPADRLGLTGATALVVGSIVGVGIFNLPSSLAPFGPITLVSLGLTTIGALYLCVVCLLPEMLISRYSVPFYFGGTSLMIVVSVTMDTVTQIQSHLLAHQYEGLIRKSRVKGRGR